MLIGAAILISVTYLAARMFTGLVNTPPTPLSTLHDQPREQAVLPGEVLQLRVSPGGEFLAVLALGGEIPGPRLYLYRLEEGLVPLVDVPVRGYRLDWREDGGRPLLLYEDAGDIWQLDPEMPAPLNLAPGDPSFDSDPLPSPDGAALLFKRTPLESEGRPQLWALFPGSGEARHVAPWNGEPRWSPDGSRIAVLFPLEGSSLSEQAGFQVELLGLSEGSRRLITLRRREVLHLEWDDPDNLLLVCLYRPDDGSEARGVVYRREARTGGEEKAIGTLRSIGEEDRGRCFRLDREDRRLAYLGSSGLEFFDLAEERIYREEYVTDLDALDWLPEGKGMVIARDGIIYLLYFER